MSKIESIKIYNKESGELIKTISNVIFFSFYFLGYCLTSCGLTIMFGTFILVQSAKTELTFRTIERWIWRFLV